MATTWMYDGFPLRRADQNTAGDDYQYVIQSLDASIRHVFGFPTGVSMEPAFSIDEDGNVEILQSLIIGSSVEIDEIVDSIPSAAASDEDEQLATVNAIRAFIGDAVEVYLQSLDTFVLKAGDTMTGSLVANGGITATSLLNITNANFTNDPILATGMALTSGGADLIQFSSGVLVGDPTESLRLTGSGSRPRYKSSNVALVEDLVDATGMVLAYVPAIGGTFSGTVVFDNGITLSSSTDFEMEYNAGADSFVAMTVGTDALGDVVLDSGAGIHRFTGDVRIDEALQLSAASVWYDVLTYASSQVQLGNNSLALNLLGSATRPLYKGNALALLTDAGGTYSAGSGITISGGGAISVTTNGINISHMPIGDYGEYLRISALGVLEWDSLDVVAGTGMAVNEDPVTKQLTVAIDNLGVDTAQLAADAVDGTKIADDAVDVEHINASGTLAAGTTYTLTVTDSAMEWSEGGAGGSIVGVAERIQAITGFVTYNNQETWSGSSGPYLVEPIVHYGDLASPNEGSVKVVLTVDGNQLSAITGDELGYTPGNGAEVLLNNTVIIAKETLSIQAYGGGPVVPDEGGYVRVMVQRLE